MQGRNGADRLFYILVVGYVALMFINVIAQSKVIYLLGAVMFVYAVFRYFSKNLVKRRRENDFAQRVCENVTAAFSKTKSRGAQNKTHCFRKCPNCGKTLRLPRIKGKHNTRCPSCGCQFSVRVFVGRGK
jgi:DNA-directed RNA polymerase subunit RPC12/RpoP